MPLVSVPYNRRNFLRIGAIAGVATLFAPSALRARNADSVRWAWLADTHVPADPANEFRGFRPYDNTQKVVPLVAESGVEGAVIAGDLGRLDGEVGEYESLTKLLNPLMEQIPVALALGNHDNRVNFREYFSDFPGEMAPVQKHVSIIETGPARFIVLDSLMFVNLTPGQLGKQQRDWLEEFLGQADDKPTIVFVHHTLNDSDGALVDADRFLRILGPVPSVKAVVYGHSHSYQITDYEGIHLINIPAVGYNFRDIEPVGWIEAEIASSGVELTLRAIAGNVDRDGETVSLEWRG